MDKEALFKPRLAEREIPLDGVGTVRVRALSRAEALKVQGQQMSTAKMERVLLSLAMVDPVLTEDDVAEWQKVSGAGELQTVVEVVTDLSGMRQEAAKSGVPGDGE